jgi:hypothetical protein
MGVPGPCTALSQFPTEPPGRFRIDQVGNQFGGLMRLAGILFNTVNIQSGGGVLRGPIPVPLTGVGGSLGGRVMATGTLTHTTLNFSVPAYATITFLPWTTARLRVEDLTGVNTYSTVTTTGYDMRNATGAGNIQLVTGWLTHLFAGGADDSLGQVVMTLALPEPTGTLMLGAGLSLLVGLYRASRRR